jgi:hypothetical protein
MEEKTSRMTVDITKKNHIKIKSYCAATGKTIRSVMNELIEQRVNGFMADDNDCYECGGRSHVPNEETRETIENIEKGKNIVRAKDIKDLFKKLEI